jgi:hypothetical protein
MSRIIGISEIIAILFISVLIIGCENNDPTGPVVNNSGSENSFAFGDRAGGSVTASAPPRPVITPVFQDPPPQTIVVGTGFVEDGSACVQSAGTSTRTRTC